MKISTSMLRTISKKGAYACIKDAREKGIIW
jgi:ribosomal protein L28